MDAPAAAGVLGMLSESGNCLVVGPGRGLRWPGGSTHSPLFRVPLPAARGAGAQLLHGSSCELNGKHQLAVSEVVPQSEWI